MEKVKMICLATGEIFEDVEIIGESENPMFSEMIRIREHGKEILINTDFILTVEPYHLKFECK